MLSIPLKPWEVRGILDGTLHQLVRPVMPQPTLALWDIKPLYGDETWHELEWEDFEDENGEWDSREILVQEWKCPFGKPGDVLRTTILEGACEVIGITWEPLHGTVQRNGPAILNVETKVERLHALDDSQIQKCGFEIQVGKERLSGDLLSFSEQWNTDYPETPWESNPWVFVATIRRVENEQFRQK